MSLRKIVLPAKFQRPTFFAYTFLRLESSINRLKLSVDVLEQSRLHLVSARSCLGFECNCLHFPRLQIVYETFACIYAADQFSKPRISCFQSITN
jgi:hypothetical protein